MDTLKHASSFRDLIVYQKSRALAKEMVCHVFSTFPLNYFVNAVVHKIILN